MALLARQNQSDCGCCGQNSRLGCAPIEFAGAKISREQDVVVMFPYLTLLNWDLRAAAMLSGHETRRSQYAQF